jgi:endonuclease YncB( thermonuclease family)
VERVRDAERLNAHNGLLLSALWDAAFDCGLVIFDKLNAEMVRLDWALAYRPGNDPFPRPEYEADEAEAGAAGRGMWRGTFIPPWEWRHR